MNWCYSLYKNRELKILNFNYDYNENLLVCRQINNTRQFGMFKSYTHFQKFQEDLTPDERCFYEVILGKKERKPYFDIDIDTNEKDITKEQADDMIQILVDNIKDALYEFEPRIIVFTSHRTKKLSYHIVVDGVYVKDNEVCKAFKDKVLPIHMKEYVDGRVYNSGQQMRILGSTKHGKNNTKIIDFMLSDNFYIPSDIKHDSFRKQNFLLQSSLITFTENCEYYKMKEVKKKKQKISKGNSSELDIDNAVKILNKTYDNFEMRQAKEQNGNILVELVSEKPYVCKIHNRVHENENAYITIQGLYRDIWFDCRRIEAHEKHLAPQKLGTLGLPKKTTKVPGFKLNSEN